MKMQCGNDIWLLVIAMFQLRCLLTPKYGARDVTAVNHVLGVVKKFEVFNLKNVKLTPKCCSHRV